MDEKEPTPKTETSPKVWVALVSMLGVGALTGLLDALEVVHFAALGAYGPVAFSVVTAVVSGALMWLKNDKLRNYGAIMRDAHGEGNEDPDPFEEVEVEPGVISTRAKPGSKEAEDRVPGPDHRAE